MGYKTSLALLIVILCGLVLPVTGFTWPWEMPVIEKANYAGDKVYMDEPWAKIEVTPHTAFSLPTIRNFTQTIKVCNNYNAPQYLFLDYYFANDVESSSIARQKSWTEQQNTTMPRVDCYSEGKEPDNQTICIQNGTETITQNLWRESKIVLNSDQIQRKWGNVSHYIINKGEYVEGYECNNYVLNYKPNKADRDGKWYMRVWGNDQDDWSCIEKENCNFDYHLDPTFTTNFSYKKSFQFMNPSWNISNYTVDLILDSSNIDLSHVQSDFDDVIFTNYDETAMMPCYRNSYTGGTTANFSILISNFTNASNTTIWAYYGNASATTPCYEPNAAYLLYDAMNTSTINTTIWNQRVGARWGANPTLGKYNATTTVAESCYAFYAGGTCDLEGQIYANTSGVYKSSQSIELTATINTTNGAACGWSLGAGKSTTRSLGISNASITNLDNWGTQVFVQNGSIISSTAGNAITQVYTQLFRIVDTTTVNRGFYEWLNNTVNTAPVLMYKSINKTGTSNYFLNDTNVVGIGITDGSGAAGCGMSVYDFKVKAYINGTVTYTNSSEIEISQYSNFTVNSTVYESIVFETGLSNFSVNVTLDLAVFNNVTAVNFSYDGFVYDQSYMTNSSVGNVTTFSITIRPDLVVNNATTRSFNFSVIANSNVSNEYKYNANNTQTVLWAVYPIQINVTANTTETRTESFNYSIINHVPGSTASLIAVLDYNSTNVTSIDLFNTSTIYSYQTNLSVGFVPVSTVTNLTVDVRPFVNVTFNGTTLARNKTSVTAIQTVNKMILHDCVTTAAYQSGVVINYTIVDVNTLAQVATADLTSDHNVWNDSSTLYRTYLFNVLNNATPWTCMMPLFGSLNTTATLTYGGDSYITTQRFLTDLGLWVGTHNITLYLSPVTGATNITFTVVDENDAPVENATITIERLNISSGNYTLVASGRTDFQGQKQLAVDLNYQYRVNISDDNDDLYTLTSGLPASVGPFEILTTSLTFRVLIGRGSSLQPYIDALSLDHNLTWTNSTDTFTLDYYDGAGLSTEICLQAWQINTTNQTLLGENCSSSAYNSLNVDVGNVTGYLQGRALFTSASNGEQYVLDTLDVYRPYNSILGNESIWVVFIVGTTSLVGLVITGGNPTGAIVGSLLGVGISNVMGIIVVSWGVFIGLCAVAGIIIYSLRT